MHVRRVELTDFRSYERVAVDLDPGVSVLVGQNGMGKTNLIEALGYVATLDSHRVATDAPLVRAGAASAVIRCAIVHDGRELLVELEIVPGKANRARLNRSPVRRPREVLGALRMVLFAPEDLELVRGDPADRRRYLDDLLVARQPRYAGVRADYDRVVKQRNALLRTAYLTRKVGGTRGQDLSTLAVWDQHLAHHGAELLAGRLELTASLGPHLTKAYDAVAAGRSAASIAYASRLGDALPPDRPALEQALLASLGERRDGRDRTRRHAGRPAPRRPALAAGRPARQGIRQPRRVLVVRAGSAAGRVRPAALRRHRAGAGARRRLRRARRRPPRPPGRPGSDAAQLLVTCAVPEDVPAALRGARYDVADGIGDPCRTDRIDQSRAIPEVRRPSAHSAPGPPAAVVGPGAGSSPGAAGGARAPPARCDADGAGPGEGDPRRGGSGARGAAAALPGRSWRGPCSTPRWRGAGRPRPRRRPGAGEGTGRRLRGYSGPGRTRVTHSSSARCWTG